MTRPLMYHISVPDEKRGANAERGGNLATRGSRVYDKVILFNAASPRAHRETAVSFGRRQMA